MTSHNSLNYKLQQVDTAQGKHLRPVLQPTMMAGSENVLEEAGKTAEDAVKQVPSFHQTDSRA
jgi:hypothetical protein